jgi:hypothetical protein
MKKYKVVRFGAFNLLIVVGCIMFFGISKAGELTPPTFTTGQVLDKATLDGAFGPVATEVTNNAKDLQNHASDPSAHHNKTTSFSDLTDQASDSQIPSTITRDTELSAHASDSSAHHARYTDAEAVSALSNLLPAVKEGTITGLGTAITATDSTTTQNVTSLTITPDSPGYVLVFATGTAGINQSATLYNRIDLSITPTSQGYDSEYTDFFVFSTSGAASGIPLNWVPFSFTRVEAVTQGTSTTFYLTAFRDANASNTVYVARARLTALFIPNALP